MRLRPSPSSLSALPRRHGQGARRTFSTTLPTRAQDGQVVLNRYSRTVTQPKTQGASQAMLYATEGVNVDEDLNKPMVGVASVWCVTSFLSSYTLTEWHSRYEGNP